MKETLALMAEEEMMACTIEDDEMMAVINGLVAVDARLYELSTSVRNPTLVEWARKDVRKVWDILVDVLRRKRIQDGTRPEDPAEA